jgi:hypothetical protein
MTAQYRMTMNDLECISPLLDDFNLLISFESLALSGSLGQKIIHSFACAVNNDSLGWHNLQAYVASGKGCESFLQRQLLQIANATSPFASLSFNKMFQKLFNISQVQN